MQEGLPTHHQRESQLPVVLGITGAVGGLVLAVVAARQSWLPASDPLTAFCLVAGAAMLLQLVGGTLGAAIGRNNDGP